MNLIKNICGICEKVNKKIAIIGGSAFLIAIIIGVSAFFVGYEFGRLYPKTVVIENITNLEKGEITETSFGIFWEAWDLLKNNHLKGGEATDKDMIYGAITGLVNSLGDPNTIFFPPEDSKKFEEDVNGSFGGIGAEIGIKNNQLVVIAPLKGTPAEKADLKPGDKILAVDDKSMEGVDVNSAVKKIRGEAGTEIKLLILRDKWDKPKEIKIIRAVIEVPTLEWGYIEKETTGIVKEETKDIIERDGKKMAHIKLFSFNQNAPVEFYKAVLKTIFNDVDGIILDLRNNPGGYLEVANNIAGWFLEKGTVVVKERSRNKSEIIFQSDGNGVLKNMPLVILVNKGSASASEILAGALRAQLGTKLIGTNTFGKGTVQEMKPLSDNSKIKLTIANWVLPDGTIIDENGIKPDIEVEITEKDAEEKHDTQLEKAIEVLSGIIKK